jgi:nucleolar protein 58
MARMVATKAALSIRVDALTDTDGKSEPSAPTIGIENRAKLESRLRALEHQGDLTGIRSFSDPSSSKKQKKFEMNADTKTYNTAADAVDLVATQRDGDLAPTERAVKAVLDVKEEKKRAKEERRRLKRETAAAGAAETNGPKMEVDDASQVPKSEDEDVTKAERKRLKKEAKEAKRAQAAANGDVKEKNKVKEENGVEQPTEKKKKRKREEHTGEEPSTEKKKKKRKE